MKTPAAKQTSNLQGGVANLPKPGMPIQAVICLDFHPVDYHEAIEEPPGIAFDEGMQCGVKYSCKKRKMSNYEQDYGNAEVEHGVKCSSEKIKMSNY